MSKDDYHVLVYRILSYPYERLKAGRDPEAKALNAIALDAEVNERYWHYACKRSFIELLNETKIFAVWYCTPKGGAI